MIKKIIKAFKIIFHILLDNSKGIIYVKEHISPNVIKTLSPTSSNKVKTLRKITSDLEKLKINYSISKGTLLGLYRDKKIIANDIDIDIDIFSERDIYKLIKYSKLNIFRTVIYNGRYSNIVFFDNENQMLIDIAVFIKRENIFINHSPQGEFILNKSFVRSISLMKFGDNNVLSYSSEDYLSHWYGEEWKTPKPYTQDWIYHYKKACNAFKFYDRLSVTIDLK